MITLASIQTLFSVGDLLEMLFHRWTYPDDITPTCMKLSSIIKSQEQSNTPNIFTFR